MRPRGFVPEWLLHTSPFKFVLMALLKGLALNAHMDARQVLRGAHEGAIAARSAGLGDPRAALGRLWGALG